MNGRGASRSPGGIGASRVMPTFSSPVGADDPKTTLGGGLAMRNRQQASFGSSAAFTGAGEDESEAFLPGGSDSAKGGAAKNAPFLTRAKLQLLHLPRRLRALTLGQGVKLLLALALLVVVFRFALQSYHDRGKASHFTIVSLLRDMSPEAQQADPVSHAFQFTALQSWGQLVVGGNVLVFADDATQCASILAQGPRGMQCIPVPCWHPELRKPTLDCLFRLVHQHAPTDVVAYVNGDVALYEDLSDAIASVAAQKDKFFMVGRRTNTLVSSVMLEDYRSPSFPARLRAHARKSGQLHSAYGIDAFVYRKNVLQSLAAKSSNAASAAGAQDNAVATPSSITFTSSIPGLSSSSSTEGAPSFPPFLAGVYRWDSWLLSQAILDDSVSVVDMSGSVLLVHQLVPQSKSRVKQQERIGAPYNDALAKQLSGTNYKIGTIDNADFVLEGPCARAAAGGAPTVPSCLVRANENVTDVVLFTKKASPSGYLVVLTVNHNYINLALNWVCWAQRIRFTNYILIAEDQSSASNFKKRGVAVIVKKDAPWIKNAGDYGSVEFQETMTFRTEFLMSVLHAGFHFVTADMDGLWLDDPIPYFNDAADLQGQMHKVTKISGGLVIVRATTYGRYFWNMVIECQRGNAQFLATAKPGSYVAATYTEQYCINQLSLGLASQPMFSRSLLDPWVFPDGKSFFDETQSQHRGMWPAIIHNNWIVGTGNKIKRLHDWNLASADEEAGTCLPLDHLPFPTLPNNPVVKEEQARQAQLANAAATASKGASSFHSALASPEALAAEAALHSQDRKPPAFDPPVAAWDAPPTPTPFALKLRVLTFTQVARLRRLLASLSATDWEGDQARVTLEISIDHPQPSPDEEELRGWNAVNTEAAAFEWNGSRRGGTGMRQGEKVIVEQPYHIGRIGQWLRGWTPPVNRDDELVLFLEDSAVLSPGWYKWLKRALLKYYAHPAQFDPRLMGISLTPQGLVLGETHTLRFMGLPAGGETPAPQVSSLDAVTGGEGNTRTPYELINRAHRMYKSQTYSQANTVQLFFPQQWRQFQSFLEQSRVDTLSGISGSGVSPCVPTLVSNTWSTASPSRHWYAWMTRFVYDQGYYFLYTNYDDRTAFALPQALLDQQASPVSRSSTAMRWELVGSLGASQLAAFPSSELTPVYDFQFNRVSTPDVLAWRKHITSSKVMDQCWTLDQLAGKLRRDEAEAAEALRKKEEEKARVKAEKAAAAAAEKARIKAEKDAAKAKEKAEKEAAAAAAKKKADADKKAKAKADADKKKATAKPAAAAKDAKKDAAAKSKDKKPAAAAAGKKPAAPAKKKAPPPPADEDE